MNVCADRLFGQGIMLKQKYNCVLQQGLTNIVAIRKRKASIWQSCDKAKTTPKLSGNVFEEEGRLIVVVRKSFNLGVNNE